MHPQIGISPHKKRFWSLKLIRSQHADEKIESNFDVHEKDTQNWMWYGLSSQEQLSEKSNIGAP